MARADAISQEALQACIQDEQTYQFTHFSHCDAWELGHALVSACEQMGAPLAVEIEVNHVIVFRYYPDGTGAYHDFQILTGFDNFGVDFVGTDDDGVHVGYGCEEFFLFGVFFKQHYVVAYGLENVLNTLNGHGGKGFFGSNQNFLHCVFGINDRFSSGAKVLGNETTSTLAPTLKTGVRVLWLVIEIGGKIP